jgi:uroporphyrinogen-III synthase
MFADLTPYHQLPLYGRRIIVTAPRSYARRLASEISDRGGLPILMPTVETCWLEDYSKLDTALQQIDRFDWIVFTSRNSIEAFWQRMQILELSSSKLDRCQLCAIGQDANKLTELGLKVNLIPTEPSPQGIITDLAKIPNLHQQSMLVLVPEVVGIREPNVVPQFVADLKTLGINVTRVPAYVTRSLPQKIYRVELDLIRTGKIDAIAFTSTAEVEAFLQMVRDRQDYQTCTIACFGPYTATNAKKLGLNVLIVAQDFSSFAGFADAIALGSRAEGRRQEAGGK